MLYFDESSDVVLPESSFMEAVFGRPPSSLQLGMAGLEYKRRRMQASWCSLARRGLSLGHEVTVGAQEGGMYSRRYIYIIYILLTC